MAQEQIVHKLLIDLRRRGRRLYVPSRRMRRTEERATGGFRSYQAETVSFLTGKGFVDLGDFRLTSKRHGADGSETKRCTLLSADRRIMAFGSILDFMPAKYWSRDRKRGPKKLTWGGQEGAEALLSTNEPR